jgi:hypothetical protein
LNRIGWSSNARFLACGDTAGRIQVCVCVCVCVRACVRACVRVRVCVCAFVHT